MEEGEALKAKIVFLAAIMVVGALIYKYRGSITVDPEDVKLVAERLSEYIWMFLKN